nr:TetR family transcriptional regulator [Amycolatopsis jejuensis]
MVSSGLRERKKLETHRTLAAAAIRLVDERGLDQVTVDDIAAAAGVSARTFFNYFAAKEDAVLIPHADQAERGEAVIARLAAQPAGLSAFAALVATMREDLVEIERERDEWLARLRIIEGDPALLVRATALSSAARTSTIAAIARRTGTDPEKDFFPSLLLSVVSGAVNASLGHWSALDGGRSLTEIFDEAMATVATLPGLH